MNNKKPIYLLFIISFLLTLTACQPSESSDEKAAITQFHTQLAAAQYHDIYINSSSYFKDATSEKDLTAFLEQAKSHLGSYKNGSGEFYKKSTTVKVHGPTITRLNYHSSFAKYASVEEVFSFEETDDGIKLAGYRYEAPYEKPLELAEEKAVIAQFRTQLAASQYHEIYTTTSSAFKDKISEEDLTKMLEKTKSDLGTYNSGSAKLYKRSILLTTKSGKPSLDSLKYHSSFSRYPSVEEEFTFEETENGVKLAGYSYTASPQ